MDRTLRIQRLMESLGKWEGILASKDSSMDKGAYDCPCCAEWLRAGPICSGCPISDFTGLNGCAGTPYREFDAAERATLYRWSDDIEESVNAMITFIKNLIEYEECRDEYEIGGD